MKTKGLGRLLGVLIVFGLIANPVIVNAETVGLQAAPEKKKQKFKLDPKKESFIDFDKLGKLKQKEDVRKFGRVELKPKSNKKPAAVFKFGAPIPTSAGGHEVSVELVALSLTSVNQVPLDPFLDPADRDPKITGDVLLGLEAPAINRKTPAKFDSASKKGKIDIKLSKALKVKPDPKSAPPGNKKKDTVVLQKKLNAEKVSFFSRSPIAIDDPGFCLTNPGASICLAPMNPVPVPGALGLFAIGLAALFGLCFTRRRPGTLFKA